MKKLVNGLVSGMVVSSVLLMTGCGDKKEDTTSNSSADTAKAPYVLKFSHVVCVEII